MELNSTIKFTQIYNNDFLTVFRKNSEFYFLRNEKITRKNPFFLLDLKKIDQVLTLDNFIVFLDTNKSMFVVNEDGKVDHLICRFQGSCYFSQKNCVLFEKNDGKSLIIYDFSVSTICCDRIQKVEISEIKVDLNQIKVNMTNNSVCLNPGENQSKIIPIDVITNVGKTNSTGIRKQRKDFYLTRSLSGNISDQQKITTSQLPKLKKLSSNDKINGVDRLGLNQILNEMWGKKIKQEPSDTKNTNFDLTGVGCLEAKNFSVIKKMSETPKIKIPNHLKPSLEQTCSGKLIDLKCTEKLNNENEDDLSLKMIKKNPTSGIKESKTTKIQIINSTKQANVKINDLSVEIDTNELFEIQKHGKIDSNSAEFSNFTSSLLFRYQQNVANEKKQSKNLNVLQNEKSSHDSFGKLIYCDFRNDKMDFKNAQQLQTESQNQPIIEQISVEEIKGTKVEQNEPNCKKEQTEKNQQSVSSNVNLIIQNLLSLKSKEPKLNLEKKFSNDKNQTQKCSNETQNSSKPHFENKKKTPITGKINPNIKKITRAVSNGNITLFNQRFAETEKQNMFENPKILNSEFRGKKDLSRTSSKLKNRHVSVKMKNDNFKQKTNLGHPPLMFSAQSQVTDKTTANSKHIVLLSKIQIKTPTGKTSKNCTLEKEKQQQSVENKKKKEKEGKQKRLKKYQDRYCIKLKKTIENVVNCHLLYFFEGLKINKKHMSKLSQKVNKISQMIESKIYSNSFGQIRG